MVDDYSEIVFQNFNYPVFYEKRNGLMQMADPAFMGDVVTKAEAVSSETNLRESLAMIEIEGENPLVAKAMVNRTWGQFFGYGFTRPVDDMGPHNAASHPELLERLSSGVREEQVRPQAACPLDLQQRSLQPHKSVQSRN